MSYAGVEHERESPEPRHCGNRQSHPQHTTWHYGGKYTVCTGQLACEHDRDARYDGLS